MFHRYKFVIASLLVVLASAALAYAVGAAVLSSMRPAGTTRFAVIQNSSVIATSATSWTTASLSQSVTIPAGKHGDIFISFCAPAKTTAGLIYVRAMINSVAALPGSVVFHEGNLYGSNCANFFRTALTAGTRTISIQWYVAGGPATAWMYGRSMVITLNVY